MSTEINQYDDPHKGERSEHYPEPNARTRRHPDGDPWGGAVSRCGWTGKGGCLLSGTEHCDFMCPFDATAHAESDTESTTTE